MGSPFFAKYGFVGGKRRHSRRSGIVFPIDYIVTCTVSSKSKNGTAGANHSLVPISSRMILNKTFIQGRHTPIAFGSSRMVCRTGKFDVNPVKSLNVG